jgi:hypothetical protein
MQVKPRGWAKPIEISCASRKDSGRFRLRRPWRRNSMSWHGVERQLVLEHTHHGQPVNSRGGPRPKGKSDIAIRGDRDRRGNVDLSAVQRANANRVAGSFPEKAQSNRDLLARAHPPVPPFRPRFGVASERRRGNRRSSGAARREGPAAPLPGPGAAGSAERTRSEAQRSRKRRLYS